MFDHIGFPVSDLSRSTAFYKAVLAPLQLVLVMEIPPDPDKSGGHAGFGFPGRPQFWIGSGKPMTGRLHVAFAANDHGAVNAFYNAALKAGGTDNGAPGIRPDYHAHYYAAFVLDPDGHNIEAVCHFPGRFQDQFRRSDGIPK